MAAAKKKVAAKKKAAAPKAKGDQPRKRRASKFGQDLTITNLPEENPRRKDSVTFNRFKEMMAYVKRRPTATVAEVCANTSYRPQDFQWDLSRRVFKTKRVTGAPAAQAQA